jgi:hypothetical protein
MSVARKGSCKAVMVHELKILHEYFEAVLNGERMFKIQKNDCGYRVGDTVRLRECDGDEYTGRETSVTIKYVSDDCMKQGLDNSFCIIGF